MRKILVCMATIAAASFATSANAVPNLGAKKEALQAASSSSGVERVHYRNWRHSHRRNYWRGRHYGYGYRRGPSIYLNFGGSRYRDRGYGNYGGYDRGYW